MALEWKVQIFFSQASTYTQANSFDSLFLVYKHQSEETRYLTCPAQLLPQVKFAIYGLSKKLFLNLQQPRYIL